MSYDNDYFVAGMHSVEELADIAALAAKKIVRGEQESSAVENNPISSVNHPPHYNSHPSGIECITVVEHMGFNLGNALKYIWRADLKVDAIEDIRKAIWYLNRELKKRGVE